MLKLTSRMGSLLRPAAQCTACRAPSASVREIHVEAHLERIGVKLPVAIVPPQGKHRVSLVAWVAHSTGESELVLIVVAIVPPQDKHRVSLVAYVAHSTGEAAIIDVQHSSSK